MSREAHRNHSGERVTGMTLAVWGHPHEEFPAGHDSAAEMTGRLEFLRGAGIEVYYAYIAIAGEHYFSSDLVGPATRELLDPLMEAGTAAEVEIHPVIGIAGPIGGGSRYYEPAHELATVFRSGRWRGRVQAGARTTSERY
jgi:hypothetical protein